MGTNAERDAARGGRQPRDQRPDTPPRLVLAARDLAILRDIGEQRLLTAELVAWRHFPGRGDAPVEERATVSWAVQRRLLLLWRAGYLRRILRPLRVGEGQAAIAYALEEAGATVLARAGDVDRARLGPTGGRRPLESLFVDHTLAVARCWAALATACERTANLRLVDWRGESTLKREGLAERVRVRAAESERAVPVMPDGTCCLELDGARARYFLEVDMGTATNRVVAEKIRAYAAYLRTAHYAEHYGEGRCFILWVAPTDRRLANALRTIAGAVDGEPVLRDGVLGATLDAMTPGRILEAIWRVAGGDERRALVRRGVRPAR